MPKDEHITPEEAHEDYQHLIHGLQTLYTTEYADAHSLARVQQRLLNRNSNHSHASPVSQPPTVLKTHAERSTAMNTSDTSRPRGSTWSHRLNTLAAVVFVTLLVGSMLLVFTHLRQGSTTVGSGPGIQPTSTFTPTLNPGWQVVTQFTGTGNQSITHQNIKVPSRWAIWTTCLGQGIIGLHLTGKAVNNTMIHGGCSFSANDIYDYYAIFVFTSNPRTETQTTLQRIDVTAHKGNTWQLHIAKCVDNSLCNTTSPIELPQPKPGICDAPIPTPASSDLTPAPRPTITRPGCPTPTIEPSPTPTIEPTRVITPTPPPSPTPTPHP